MLGIQRTERAGTTSDAKPQRFRLAFILLLRETESLFTRLSPDFKVSRLPPGFWGVPARGVRSPGRITPGVGIPGWEGPSIRVRGCGAAERGRRVGITPCVTSPGFSRAGSFPVNCCDSRSGPSPRFPFSHPDRSGLPARDPGAGQSTGKRRQTPGSSGKTGKRPRGSR